MVMSFEAQLHYSPLLKALLKDIAEVEKKDDSMDSRNGTSDSYHLLLYQDELSLLEYPEPEKIINRVLELQKISQINLYQR